MEMATAEDSQGEVARPGSLGTRQTVDQAITSQTVDQATTTSSGTRSCLTLRWHLTHPTTGMESRAEQHGAIKSEDT